MHSTDTHEHLIARYLNGHLSDEEEDQMLAWINENSENKKLFFELKDSWEASLKSQDKTQKELLRFYQKRAEKQVGLHWSWWKNIATAAAILLIGLFIGTFIIQKNSSSVQLSSYSVPLGSKSNIVLNDGTRICLNSGSELKLGKDFSPSNRTVELEGEAYFEVQSDKKHPFVVRTKQFEVLVTGTRFNISAYADDHFSSAGLIEGKIAIKTNLKENFNLSPGRKIFVNQESGRPHFVEFDEQAEIAWKDNHFIFKDIAFPELIRKLERWYDVKLQYSDKRLDLLKYNGKFKNQETIWQILDALQLTSPITYEKKNFREFELTLKPM